MIEIIHVSDLHFRWIPFFNRKARRLLKEIGRRYSFAKESQRYLLITGDITNGGRSWEYSRALKFLRPFSGRILLTPGNHDYGAFYGTLYEEEKARYFDSDFAERLGFKHPYFSRQVYSNILDDGAGARLMVIGLNSNRTVDYFDGAKGKIGVAQLTRLKDVLHRADPDLPKLLFLHHIPHRDARGKWLMNLLDWKDLRKVFEGKVDAVAFGHDGSFIKPDKREQLNEKSASMAFSTIMMHFRKTFFLDANKSVAKQQYYRVTVDANSRLDVQLESL